VILAAGLDERICFAAHSHGARRYLLETASAEMIRETLRLTGEMFLLDPVLMPRILENAPNGVLPGIGNQTLIPREQEVFRLLNDGLTQRAIGERLCISQATVKTHVAHILRKLDMKRRPVLAFPAPACAESHAHSPYQITASKARRGSGR
jgi:DNA-binding NarL/FixJ family response regulator